MKIVVKEVGLAPEVRDIPDSLDAMHQILKGHLENVFVGADDDGMRFAIACNEHGTLEYEAHPDYPRTEPMAMNLKIPAINRMTGEPDLMIIHGPVFFTKYTVTGASASLTQEEVKGAVEFLDKVGTVLN